MRRLWVQDDTGGWWGLAPIAGGKDGDSGDGGDTGAADPSAPAGTPGGPVGSEPTPGPGGGTGPGGAQDPEVGLLGTEKTQAPADEGVAGMTPARGLLVGGLAKADDLARALGLVGDIFAGGLRGAGAGAIAGYPGAILGGLVGAARGGFQSSSRTGGPAAGRAGATPTAGTGAATPAASPSGGTPAAEPGPAPGEPFGGGGEPRPTARVSSSTRLAVGLTTSDPGTLGTLAGATNPEQAVADAKELELRLRLYRLALQQAQSQQQPTLARG